MSKINCNTIGIVISTYGNPAYVHLHLENRKRYYPEVQALVSDDCSDKKKELEELCNIYGADFVSNDERLGHYHGDLRSFVNGIRWAFLNKLDFLVKMSRSWLVCKPWVEDFKKLVELTQYPTYSNKCDHYGFGFRSECLGMHVQSWMPKLGEMMNTIKERSCSHVESYLDQKISQKIELNEEAKAYKPDHPGYATWDLLGTNRHQRPQGILWHDNTPEGEYHLLSAYYGFKYSMKDFNRSTNDIVIPKKTIQKEYKKIHLRQPQSPGDVLVLTACVESLHKQFPNEYKVSVKTTCQEIWNNNPYVENIPISECEDIQMHYPGIHSSHLISTGHFMKCFCDYLGEKLKIPLKLQVNKPSLFLTEAEKTYKWFDKPYIVMNSGVKQDYTCKGWGHESFQKVVEALKHHVMFVQIGESHHLHKPINGAVNMIGKTNVRELISLVYGSVGGLGGVTFLQHICAALEKWYGCFAGGREPKWFTEYATQTTYSTMGMLPCCKEKACWKSRVTPIGDNDNKDNELCLLPVIRQTETVPACMDAIKPETVISDIKTLLKYNTDHNKKNRIFM